MNANLFIPIHYLSFALLPPLGKLETFIYKFLVRYFFTKDSYLIFQYTFLFLKKKKKYMKEDTVQLYFMFSGKTSIL